MPAPARVPHMLLTSPFTVSMAREAGLPVKSLRGKRFVQLMRGVHAHVGLTLTTETWIEAARLSMPAHAHLSHLTRIQALGLDLGALRPFHFTVSTDLHLAGQDVFLHRTPRLPPTDELGVSPTAAFIGACSWETLIDLVKVGDWLLHHGHMTLSGLQELARRESWRAGAPESLLVSSLLDERARSVRESETRMLLMGAGLPRPEVNRPVLNDPDSPTGDLWYPAWRVCIEYEGSQHFDDRGQALRDISRYSAMRMSDVAYVQVVNEMMSQPRALVRHVHDVLVSRGYDGPPPDFGPRWHHLFMPLRKRPAWEARRSRDVG